MFVNDLSGMWSSMAPALGNHLWQSTLFALVAGLLTLTMRKSHAQARYALWLAASLKFLLPFSLLVSIGNHLANDRLWSTGSTARQAGSYYFLMEQVTGPLKQGAMPAIFPVASATSAPSAIHLLPATLAAIWLCGFLAVLMLWCARWRRVSAAMRQAVPLREGREVEALRRLERLAPPRKSIELRWSPTTLEPGIFGIIRPVLVWPEGISRHLDDSQLEAILAHELCHVRRRDNLAALIHMAVEALFWFHPLVWWLGARLIEERERACDEEVLHLGGEPRIYAESILKACEFSVESPLACVAGVTGADLKKRIVRIMTGRAQLKVSARQKLLLAAAAFLAVAAPVGFGLALGSHGQAGQVPAPGAASEAETPLASTAKFEVASIKHNKPSGPGMMFRIDNPEGDGRFYATGPTVKMLLTMAYHVQDSQIVGGPGWINSEQFDIQAKGDSALDEQLKKLSEPEQALVKRHMLQELLADRFGLKLHHETRDLPIYALVVAKNGPKIEKAKDTEASPPEGPGGAPLATQGPGDGPGTPNGPCRGPGAPGSPCQLKGVGMTMRGGEQHIEFRDSPLAFFAEILSHTVNRTVIDKTGLEGRYNFSAHWVPDMGMMRMGAAKMGPGPAGPGPISAGPGSAGENVAIGGAGAPAGAGPETAQSSDASGPSIFTALQEQLGLKLQSEKGPVDVLVIDQVEEPSEN